ncbi:MAG: accessory factor UbiK family protein [Azoarcus sp.]|nr:accessory factor UbiK family protein [Azoarcus sp.]
MDSPRFIDEIGKHLSGLVDHNPARSLEKNIKAVFAGAVGKLDLVSRDDFEVQQILLTRALEKLAQLETRIAALESGKPEGGNVSPVP